MKILYLHQYFKFPTENGGTRSYDLTKSFIKNAHEVTVISATNDPAYKTKKKWKSKTTEGFTVKYIYLPYNNELSYIQRTLVFLKFLWFATFKLLKEKPDVVLATSTPLTIGMPALFKKWIHKTPFIFEARDVWPEAVIAIGAITNKWMQKILYFLEKTIYKNASAIVPLSTDMKKSIVSRYPKITSNKPVVVIENLSEINRFSTTKSAINLKEKLGVNPRFSILYAGTFGRVNGIDYVVELATKTLKLDPEIIFILIGDGALKKDVLVTAQENGVLNKNVFILDPITKDDLPLWYKSVNMGSSFVISIKELWANSANKFFDTLAAGKPVLINHPGWQKNTIENDNLGYVLPEKLTQQAVQDFYIYTTNYELHTIQQKNAFTKATTSYSLEIASKKYQEVLNLITKEKNV